MLGLKTSLSKLKRTEIRSNFFSNENVMKVQINYKKKTVKITNMWRLNNMLLYNYWVNEEIKGEIKKYLETNENENVTYQKSMKYRKGVLRGKFTAIQTYLKKTRKSSNKQSLHLKEIKKGEHMKRCSTSLIIREM